MKRYSEWNITENYMGIDTADPVELLSGINGTIMRDGTWIQDSIRERQEADMSFLDMTVIALTVTLKYTLFSQLQAYLKLKGLAPKSEQLWECLDILGKRGILNRWRCLQNVMDETLYVYSATSYGERIGRDIGALSMREGDKEALEHAGERSDFIREALIWNQIILNRMVYQKELRRFHTFKRIAVKKWRTVTIPLELREDNTTFVMYRVLSGTGKEVLKSVIDDWNAYAGIMCQYMVLVLVFDIGITRIGTFQDIMGHAYSHLEVVSTSVDDWISVHECTVTRYQVALSDMRRISDTVG